MLLCIIVVLLRSLSLSRSRLVSNIYLVVISIRIVLLNLYDSSFYGFTAKLIACCCCCCATRIPAT